ncbi:hypothetical protein D5272_16205 [bacterium D16-76]|nr:hypothetical protein [bacterium D16-76]
MNEIQIFEHEAFGQIRVIDLDGEPWFIAVDVCRALDISRTQTRRLDDDEKGVHLTHTPSGDQEMTIINEPGLYSLVLGSRKPEAKAFKRWVTHEVLPAIRQNGYYALMPVETSQRALTPDDYLRAATIVARCRNDRLPYVLGFLEKGGWDVPDVQNTPLKRTPIAVVVNETLAKTGLSLRQLAKLTGLCPTTICHYRNGQREPQGKNYDHVVNVLNGVIPTYKEEIE